MTERERLIAELTRPEPECCGNFREVYAYDENGMAIEVIAAECCGSPNACYPSPEEQADRVLAAGYVRLPDEGSPEEEAMVERMAAAMQVENRPVHESLNDYQRAAREQETRPAYRALASAAVRTIRVPDAKGDKK